MSERSENTQVTSKDGNWCDSAPGLTKDQQTDVLVRLQKIHKAMHLNKAYGFEQTLLCDLAREITALRGDRAQDQQRLFHLENALASKAPSAETPAGDPSKDVGDLLMAITALRQKAEDAEVLAQHVWDTATALKASEPHPLTTPLPICEAEALRETIVDDGSVNGAES